MKKKKKFKKIHISERLYLDSGKILTEYEIAYETYGKLNATSYNNPEFDKQRIEPDLLNAFKENPYTQSLSSWA